jgi:DmsE family decaheme c-type cytochrome
MICLKCHSSHSMVGMQFWPGSQHALAEVACSDCHKLHRSPRQKLVGAEINDLCISCHGQIRAQFALFSRHPLAEGKMTCVTCHEPHGSTNDRGLREMDTRALCGKCHGEKAGPFRYEHADVGEDCLTCHSPHGSAFSGLLRYQEPFLCLQCHAGHADPVGSGTPSAGLKKAMYTRCTTCHTQIHGSDTPGAHLRGGFVE